MESWIQDSNDLEAMYDQHTHDNTIIGLEQEKMILLSKIWVIKVRNERALQMMMMMGIMFLTNGPGKKKKFKPFLKSFVKNIRISLVAHNCACGPGCELVECTMT